jgi:hypothetical protein
LEVLGSLSLGDATRSNLLQINSVILGLSLEGKGAGNGLTNLALSNGHTGGYISLAEGSGTVMISSQVPTMQRVSVLSKASINLEFEACGDVILGTPIDAPAMQATTPLDGSDALHFAGRIPADNRSTDLLVAPISSPSAILSLPDASGTVMLSTNIPTIRHNASFHEHFTSAGGTVFDGELLLGHHDATLSVSLERARMSTPTGLKFEPRHSPSGGAVDAKIILGVEEPSGRREVKLPDVSGSILTTHQLADTPFERLRVLQDVRVEGDLAVDAEHVQVGWEDGVNSAPDYVSILAKVRGSLPLSFDCNLPSSVRHGSTDEAEGSTRHVCLSIQRLLSEHDNTITLPDTSGTVITSANLPNPLVANDKFTLSADVLVVNAEEGVWVGTPPYRPNVMAQTQLESMLGNTGCFVFTDSLPQPPAPVQALQASSSGAPLLSSQGPRKLTDRDNQMVVIARGGAIFQTGHTHSTRMLGSVLKPGASCWSSLSDRNLKVNVSNVDTQIVADSLMHHVPISTWQYKSGTNAERDPDHQDGHGVRRGGGGGEVRHVGPMAQDLWEAFEVGSDPRRIDTIDSDGITLAAVQGAAHKQRRVSSASDALRARIKELKAALQAQERQLAVQAEELLGHARRIGLLQGRLAGPPSPVTPSSFGLFAKAF